MEEITVINTIVVPAGMEKVAEEAREEYLRYFEKQEGFVSLSFYKSIERESDDSLRYVNIVVWKSYEHFKNVVNDGFKNTEGENSDGMRVLGRGFPEPIVISPARYTKIG